MKRMFTLLGLAAAAACAGSTSAWAQSAPSPGFDGFNIKVHAGATAGNLKDDLHAQNLLGLGLEGVYALTPTSSIISELTFSAYGAGRGYDNTKLSGPVWASTGESSVGDLPIILTTGTSVDYRKNSLQGFSLRGGYRATFQGMWSWQAGLTLDRMQYRQEARGTLQPRLSGAAYGNLEGFAVTPTKTGTGFGAFAGVKAQISENFTFETNLLSVGYTSVDYVPFTYSGKAPSYTTKNRHGVLLEVSFGLKL